MIAALLLLSLAGGGDSGRDTYELDRVQDMVTAAHVYLVAQQRPDGSFSIDRKYASQLMTSMILLLNEIEGTVDGLPPEELASFREWVDKRAQLASQTLGEVSDARSW